MLLRDTEYNSIVCITSCPIIKRVFETVDKYLQDNRDRELYTILPDLQRLIFEQADALLDSPYKEQSKACAKVLFKLAIRIQKRLQASK